MMLVPHQDDNSQDESEDVFMNGALEVVLIGYEPGVRERFRASFEAHPEIFSVRAGEHLQAFWGEAQEGNIDVIIANAVLLLEDLDAMGGRDLSELACPILATSEREDETQTVRLEAMGVLDYRLLRTGVISRAAELSLWAIREWRYRQERELANALFCKKEQHFRAVFDHSPDAVMLVDGASGRIFDWNEAFSRLFSYSRERLEKMHFSQLFDSDYRYTTQDVLKRVRIYGTVIERQHFASDEGELRQMDVTATVIPWDSGHALLVTLRDVAERVEREEAVRRLNNHLAQWNEMLESRVKSATEDLSRANQSLRAEVEVRRRAEARQEGFHRALEEAHAMVRCLIDSTPDWIYVQDRDFRFQLVNRTLAEALGMEVESIIGKRLHEVGFLPKDLEKPEASGERGMLDHARHVMEGGVADMNALEEVTLGKRTEVFEAIRMPLRSASGEINGVMCVARKVTERERVRRELLHALDRERELGELKSTFVNMVSHEFRTPMAAVHSTVDLLKKYWERLDEGKREQYFASIQSGVTRMANMMEDLLVLGQLQSNKFVYSPSDFKVPQLWNSLMMHLENHGEALGRLKLDYGCREDVLYGDTRLLVHILVNLITNALKYSKDEIGVHFACRDKKLVIRVSDQGIGIPEAEQQRVSDLFYRASNVEGIKGVGVGMYVVSRCVEIHGGTLRCESRQGVGTTFEVVLPMNKPQKS